MYTVELTADMLARGGRIVTDHTVATLPTMAAAIRVAQSHWQRISRRRGTQLHMRLTYPGGQIVTHRYRRD